MKKKTVLLLAFVLMLYIAPMIFAPSSYETDKQSEVKREKEFSASLFWYNDAWLYRKQILVVEQAGAGTNYQIPIVGYYDDPTKDIAGSVDFEGLSQTDFDDIRFTTSNGITALDFWIDDQGFVAGTTARFWVEVKANISLTASNVSIFTYFGNAEATSASNITNTFLFADDFSAALSASKWDTVDNAPAIGSGLAVFTRPAGVNSQHSVIIADNTLGDGNYRVRTGWKWGVVHVYDQRYSYFGFGGSYLANPTLKGAVFRDVSSTTTAFQLEEFDSDTDVDNDDETFGAVSTSYQYSELRWLSGVGATIYATNGTTTVSKPKAYATTLRPTIGIEDAAGTATTAVTLTVQYIFVSKWQVTEPTFAAPAELETNDGPTPSWHSIDSAELLFETPYWGIIITATVKFWTGVDTTYLNWLLIFLGLIMIPMSTVYLVEGGRDELSAKKLFYFVVAFMLGWGLLLGGIM